MLDYPSCGAWVNLCPRTGFFHNTAVEGEEVEQSVGAVRPWPSVVLILCFRMPNVCYYHHLRVDLEP